MSGNRIVALPSVMLEKPFGILIDEAIAVLFAGVSSLACFASEALGKGILGGVRRPSWV